MFLQLFFIVSTCFSFNYGMKFTKADTSLKCNSNNMSIEFDLVKLRKHNRPFSIKFKYTDDPECSLKATETNTLTSKFNKCGITLTAPKGEFVYRQTVVLTYGKNPKSNGLKIIREEKIQFDYECHVDDAVVHVHLSGKGFVEVKSIEEQTISKTEEGKFDVRLYRTTDNTFTSKDNSYQLKLGDQVYFKLELNSIRNDLRIAPQTCYATSTKHSEERYYLIEDGCPNRADGTVKITETNDKKTFEWEHEAFKFFGGTDAVFVTCDVTICEDNNRSPACERCDFLQRRRRRNAIFYAEHEDGLQKVIVHSDTYAIV